MILPDVNVLVYAYRVEAERHDDYARWLGDVVRGSEELALVDTALTGFLRIVTSGRIFANPAPTSAAMEFVDRLRWSARGRLLAPTHAAWDTIGSMARTDHQVRGNLVPDAHLAAMAITYHARLATSDRGFARFAGLEWFDPVAPK